MPMQGTEQTTDSALTFKASSENWEVVGFMNGKVFVEQSDTIDAYQDASVELVDVHIPSDKNATREELMRMKPATENRIEGQLFTERDGTLSVWAVHDDIVEFKDEYEGFRFTVRLQGDDDGA